MGYYDLTKQERDELYRRQYQLITSDLEHHKIVHIEKLASDHDTYIRKNAYLIIGRIYATEKGLRGQIIGVLQVLFKSPNELIRQTVMNAFGEIGKFDANPRVMKAFEQGLFDAHHKVRNAVIGSLKKMGQVNPAPMLAISKKFLHHPDVEVRRQAVHGIELRGRTHPEDVLPLLKESQWEEKARVRNMVIHVIIQISYKKGCLQQVLASLKTWENEKIVGKCLVGIYQKHQEDSQFTYLTSAQAKQMIRQFFPHASLS